MNPDFKRFQKFHRLYSIESLGSGSALRAFLNLKPDFPLPLTISHGLDFGCDTRAIDVDSPEPIYWANNEMVAKKARLIKPTIILPHPWLLLTRQRTEARPKREKLLIAPPPGPNNDLTLLNILRAQRDMNVDILIKERGPTAPSKIFWRQNGYKTLSAGERDSGFYHRLYGILESYEEIIGCTLSSAIFFAASLGIKCRLIENYTVRFYDSKDWEKIFHLSDEGRTFARDIVNQKHDRYFASANKYLGSQHLDKPDELRAELLEIMSDTKHPIHYAYNIPNPLKPIVNNLGLLAGRKRVFSENPFSILKSLFGGEEVSLIETNEIKLWLNGKMEDNPKTTILKADIKLNIWPGRGV